MATELQMQDVLKRIEALPTVLRKNCRGVVPTFKGYAVRILKAAEAEATKVLNPAEAEIQGPALGMNMNSSWVVRGIPRHVTKSQITTAFAQQNGAGWPGWLVRPRKTLSTDKVGTTAWLIDAVSEPPLRTMTINKALITIEMFFEKAGNAWKGVSNMQRQQNKAPEYLPGDIYEKEYGEVEDDAAIEDERTLEPMQVDGVRESTTKKEANSMDITMEDKSARDDTKKRKLLPEENEGGAAMETMQQVIKMMQAQSEAKDRQIEMLTATIQGLRADILELRAEMKEKKQSDDE